MPEDKQKLAFDISLTPDLLEIAKEAGNILMHYFDGKSPLKAIEKDDSSPVTQADIEADLFIRNALERLCPHIPVVSEEGEKMDQEKRMSSPSIWLVDPLDGTRSFIRSSPEFAVCIGLVTNTSPEFGIIYLPFWQQLYWGIKGKGAWLTEKNRTSELNVSSRKNDLVAILSHIYARSEKEEILSPFPVTQWQSASSALKFCRIAEGSADLYARKGTTMEWDTAAGHALVEAAGGRVYNPYTGTDLKYNKEYLENGPFLCSGIG